MKLSLWLSVIIIVSASSASAEDQAAKPEEKKICRTHKVTGSLNARRTRCKTQAEWDADAAAASQLVSNMQQTGGRTPEVKFDGSGAIVSGPGFSTQP